VRYALWTLTVLLSHWRKHPLQLATLLIGLISATALWSGVQALNQQARISYDRAAAIFGGARLPVLVDRDGARISQQTYIALRRAGWPASPILEGRVQLGSHAVRLIGIDPITLPAESGLASEAGDDSLQNFLLPPGETFVAPETLAALGLREGAVAVTNTGLPLPPLVVRPQLAAGVLVVDIGIAQRLLAAPDQVSRLLVATSPTGPRPPLEDVAGDRLRLVEPAAESDLRQLTDSFHLNLTAFGLLSFLVGLFIVNSAIGLTFEQRRPMLRTLRACGVPLYALNVCLLTELVLLALGSGLVGLILGSVIATALLPDVAESLRGLYGAQIGNRLTLDPQWWLSGLAMSVAGALAAAASSFVKLHRLSLLEGAQPQAWQRTQQTVLMYQGIAALLIWSGAGIILSVGDSLVAGFAVLGALLLGAALALPVALAVLLWLGERSSQGLIVKWFWASNRQQLPGLSLALMALLLALAVNVGVGTMVESFRTTFVSWLDGRLSSDLYVDAKNDAQAGDIRRWLQQRSDVMAILPGARSESQLAGQPIELMGLSDDPVYRTRWPLLETSPAAWDQLQGGNSAFVSEQLSRRLHIKLGDTVRIPTASGLWPLNVTGIYADYGNPKGQIAISVTALTDHFPATPRMRLGLRVRPGASTALISALQTQFDLDDRQVADQTTVKAESMRIFNRTFSVTAALNTFTLGVAGIALLTSLLTLGNTRLPQVAPLWAMGVTLERLSAIELLKTMALAFATALFALPLGIGVAWCLIAVVNVKAFGWRLPLHIYPMQLLTLLAIAIAAALLAAALPILKLRRLSPAQLIKIFAYER
jgi:putative ABC transport system permease protein